MGFFQKEMKPKELKMNQAKLRNMKIGLLEIIFFHDLCKQPFDFRTFKTVRSFGDDIYNNRINLDEVGQEQSDLLDYLFDFNSKTKLESKKGKIRKNDVFDSVRDLYKGRELVINTFKIGLFPLKSTTGTELKILTPKQLLQRLPIALAQVKAGNNSESLLNKTKQIVYSLYQSKEITKKVYNNIIKSIQILKNGYYIHEL